VGKKCIRKVASVHLGSPDPAELGRPPEAALYPVLQAVTHPPCITLLIPTHGCSSLLDIELLGERVHGALNLDLRGAQKSTHLSLFFCKSRRLGSDTNKMRIHIEQMC
jgi:hypothetical protein